MGERLELPVNKASPQVGKDILLPSRNADVRPLFLLTVADFRATFESSFVYTWERISSSRVSALRAGLQVRL